ncbi:5,10-methenyltetrahydrofolate synthetase [Steccherinum ochraceum]|uniref:5-formyltetrahydrofolate cyclo-ligase n=1 Tax=Steccherinum ochraceum TaxID=92696 RepID=A0A4R0R7K8_9APHY|nr:5,10-methenyltetrahydrofolate synthetase [Steccherinum ochraceum]
MERDISAEWFVLVYSVSQIQKMAHTNGSYLSALEANDEPLDLILMPGVAFDHSLSRLGHGKGYYDRFITRYTALHNGRKLLLVALALREQILEAGKVPVGENDWKVDVIVGPDGFVPAAL